MGALRLRKVTGFWKSLFFMGNVCKMRKSLIAYLQEEGLECEVKNGHIQFVYNDNTFHTILSINEFGYGECTIIYQCTEDRYERLEDGCKALIAANVNAVMANHTTTYALEEVVHVSTSFYFNSKHMLLDLFAIHFEEIANAIGEFSKVYSSINEEQETTKTRQIGFTANSEKHTEPQDYETKVAARLQNNIKQSL